MLNLSVCIPTYNRKAYLEKAIQSAVNQLKPGDEIIVQDNCSTDGTPEYFESLFGNFSNVIFNRNESNVGPVLNFGKVIESAHNNYIFLLTDDDFLLPGALNLARDFFEDSGALAFKTACFTYHEKGKTGSLRMIFKQNVKPVNLSGKMASRIFHASHVISGLCIRKELFNWEDLIANKDNWYPTMLFLGKAGMNIGYLAEPTNVHIWENETFWGVSPEKRDELNRGQVNTIKYLFEKKYIEYEHFYELVYRHFRQWPYDNNGALFRMLNIKHKVIVGLLCIVRAIVKINHQIKRFAKK